jgi:hypothetical protein
MRNRYRESDDFIGKWRLFNRVGQPTSKVVEVTNVKARKAPGMAQGMFNGWLTVGGQVEPLPQFSRAIHDGILRKEMTLK